MNRDRTLAAVLLAAALVASSFPARADPPVPMGVPDLVGPRHLAIGAYRGVMPVADGVFSNAASLAAEPRYEIMGFWLMDRLEGRTELQVFGASVIDSTAPSFAGGFAYTRVTTGVYTGTLYHAPLAAPVGDGFFLGLTPKFTSLDGPGGDEIRAFNLDASAYYRASQLLGIGVAGYNLLSTGHRLVQAKAVGAGLSVGEPRRYTVAVDWRGDFDRKGKLTNLFSAGAEYVVADLLPVRGSYTKDETRDASFWSAGFGLVSQGGFALDVSYRQRLESPSEHTVAAALRFRVRML